MLDMKCMSLEYLPRGSVGSGNTVALRLPWRLVL